MRLPTLKFSFYMSSFLACFMMALTSGCVSGGFKLTRQYAGWVNSQNIIIRIILYILTAIVFAVTILVDAVVFNTMDFWEGKVSQGTYEFNDNEKVFIVHHELLPNSKLRRSSIQVLSAENRSPIQNVVLMETPTGEIELLVDGKLRSRVRDIGTFPMAAIFNNSGVQTEDLALMFNMPMATNHLAQK